MSSALSRAAELDSTLAVVHFTRATHATWSLWNWSEGEANFKKALAANPNYAEAHAYYAHLLFITGRFEEGLAHAEKAVALDPFNALLTSLYADNLMFAGRYDDSARQFLKSQETAPNSFVTFNGLNWIYREQGHLQEANDQRIAKYEAARDTAMVAALKDGFADGGYREASLRAAALLVARSDTSFVSPILIERLYVDAGEHEPAIDWIKRAIDLKDPGVPYIGLGPDVAILSRSNRYPALLEQVNLEAHWTEPP